MNAPTAHGVHVGDVFANGKHLRAEVVDILDQRSLVTGEHAGYVIIARGLGLATNRFPVNPVTVLRNKIQSASAK